MNGSDGAGAASDPCLIGSPVIIEILMASLDYWLARLASNLPAQKSQRLARVAALARSSIVWTDPDFYQMIVAAKFN